MHSLIKKQKGFTLVEIIVSMALLSIIGAAFIMVFSTSFANIFSLGNKNDAMSLASREFENLYVYQPFEDINDLSALLVGEPVDDNNLYDYIGNDYNYTIEEYKPIEDGEGTVEGFKVTIVSFYHDGKQSVRLTSFFKGVKPE